jgi:hypothetical protein
MARITLNSIHDKLEVIHKDIENLQKSKVDKNTNDLVIQSIDVKITDVKKDVENINSYGKWLIMIIGATVVAAILRLIIIK